MKKHFLLFILLVGCCMFSACSFIPSIDIQKRHYRHGFSVHVAHKKELAKDTAQKEMLAHHFSSLVIEEKKCNSPETLFISQTGPNPADRKTITKKFFRVNPSSRESQTHQQPANPLPGRRNDGHIIDTLFLDIVCSLLLPFLLIGIFTFFEIGSSRWYFNLMYLLALLAFPAWALTIILLLSGFSAALALFIYLPFVLVGLGCVIACWVKYK